MFSCRPFSHHAVGAEQHPLVASLCCSPVAVTGGPRGPPAALALVGVTLCLRVVGRVNGKLVALKVIRLQEEEGTPFTAIREGKRSVRLSC